MPNLSRVDPRSLPQLWAWFDAMYPNGFGAALPADAAAMSQWNDLSGNGRHLVQATGANQPLFRLTGGPNNFPSVNFVDNTDTMQIATAGARARPITVVGVVKNTVADDAAYHMAVTFNAQRIGIGLDWTGTRRLIMWRVSSPSPWVGRVGAGRMARTSPSRASRARTRTPTWTSARG